MTTEATEPLDPVEPKPAVGRRLADSLWSGRLVVQAWVLSRGLIALVALLLAVFKGVDLVNQVSNWDVQHFARLATGGYLAEPDGQLMAFFPGLPAILGSFARLGVPIWLTGLLLAAVCSALAAAALVRLGGPWAAIGWLFAPTAVFTTVPYTESLFGAAAFRAWERARADKGAAANRSMMCRTASRAAMSPPPCPPAPSATTQQRWSSECQWPQASSSSATSCDPSTIPYAVSVSTTRPEVCSTARLMRPGCAGPRLWAAPENDHPRDDG